jgi:hypothetical protein
MNCHSREEEAHKTFLAENIKKIKNGLKCQSNIKTDLIT